MCPRSAQPRDQERKEPARRSLFLFWKPNAVYLKGVSEVVDELLSVLFCLLYEELRKEPHTCIHGAN
jgi:hypothetical protein